MSGSMGRFDVDTSEVPRRSISAADPAADRWGLSRNTATSFKLLAATSCRILTGCKRRCLKARTSGAKQAAADLAGWVSQTYGGRQVPTATLSDACNHLLTVQERPRGGAGAAASTGPATTIPPPEAEAEDEGPWDAADSAFTDDLFRTGCFLFTQFYKERTKEIRLAYVCGYRDALGEVMSVASANCTPGLSSVPAVVLAGICTMIASRATTAGAARVPAAHDDDGAAAAAPDEPVDLGGGSLGFAGGGGSSTRASPQRLHHPHPAAAAAASAMFQGRGVTAEDVVDPLAHWIPGSKREYIMDTEDEEDEQQNAKRVRSAGSTPDSRSFGGAYRL